MPQRVGPVLMVGSSVACAKCSSVGANPPTVDDYSHFFVPFTTKRDAREKYKVETVARQKEVAGVGANLVIDLS
ncbi:Protease HtpX [Trichinella spiralis]|uniref:Protease HtpX n=1 Tax=Trichinella spiralis TaxID=6334 RepID=A0ABR3KR20_TRISP